MANNKKICKYGDRKKENTPVENQRTAAWAGIEKTIEGNVPIPSLDNVEEAKHWVEVNKK